MSRTNLELKKYLEKCKIAKHFQTLDVNNVGELVVIIDKQNIIATLKFLRDDKECKFLQLVSISGVDYPSKAARFEVVYNLLSHEFNNRLMIKCAVAEADLVPSVTALYAAANWYEREAYDLYGIMFDQHPDLRRILTDYGFEGHPLRKDFPLTGYLEVRYDMEQKKVVYEPVKLSQEFRNFDFASPWEGTQYVLPGDEKATKE
ncbi:MAG: NADH-quinone oxidoreductase subunit C [Rickettsiales bacterium]